MLNNYGNLNYIVLIIFLIGVCTIIKWIFKFIKFIVKLLIDAFSPAENDNSYFDSKEHEQMRKNLEKAEAYRKAKWKDPYH